MEICGEFQVGGVNQKKESKSLIKFLNGKLKRKNNPTFSLNFLKIFTPTITSSTLGSNQSYTFKAGFYKSNFEALSGVVDVTLLNENLVKKFGMKPYDKNPDTISDRDPIDDSKLVSVFQWFLQNG